MLRRLTASRGLVSAVEHVAVKSSSRASFSSSPFLLARQHRRGSGTSNREALERDLKGQLSDLERKVERFERRNNAEEVAEKLPDLDDELLTQLYQGATAPDPVPAEELRLLEGEAARKRATLASISTSSSQTPSGPSLGFHQRLQLRLESLSRRLSQLRIVSLQQGQASASSTPAALAEIDDDLRALDQQLAEADEETFSAEIVADEVAAGTLQSHQGQDELATKDDIPEEEVERLSQSLVFDSPSPKDLPLTQLLKIESRSDILASSIWQEMGTKDWMALGSWASTISDTALLQKLISLAETLHQSDDESHARVDDQAMLGFCNAMADAYAHQCNLDGCYLAMSIIERCQLQPTKFTWHALVKAFLNDPANKTTSALELIDSLENSVSPASPATYTLVLSRLLDAEEEHVRDQAWGVWFRMKLNAHPRPDASSYSQMIRACALGSTPSRASGLELAEGHRGSGAVRPKETPRRLQKANEGQYELALDLFKEMTLNNGIRPSPACYDKLILVCCRRSDAYLQGFKFFNEMVEIVKEGQLTAYEPTRSTYNALLEGCRGAKDLVRARWVLAEMIRSSSPLWSDPREAEQLSWDDRVKLEARMPDAETIGKIFMTFASWKPVEVVYKRQEEQNKIPIPPLRGETVKQVRQEAGKTRGQRDQAKDRSAGSPQGHELPIQSSTDESASSFSARPPANSAEAVREIQGLFARVIADQATDDQGKPIIVGPLGCVKISARLLNSYLTALAAHLPKAERLEALAANVKPGEQCLYSRLGVQPEGHTYLHLLQWCFNDVESQNLSSVKEATDLAEWAWSEWRALEAASPLQDTRTSDRASGSNAGGASPKMREKIWTTRINFLCKTKQLSEAMSTLREFVALYPPQPRIDLAKTMKEPKRKMPFFDFTEVRGIVGERERLRQALREIEAAKTLEALPDVDGSSPVMAIEGAQESSPQLEAEASQPPKDEEHKTLLTSTSSPLPTPSSSSPPPRRSTPISPLLLPRLTFYDLNLLHQRLLQAGRQDELRYVGWYCRVTESVWSTRKELRKARKVTEAWQQRQKGGGLQGRAADGEEHDAEREAAAEAQDELAEDSGEDLEGNFGPQSPLDHLDTKADTEADFDGRRVAQQGA